MVIANQVSTSIDLYDVTVQALLTPDNEHLFAGAMMTSKTLQLMGVYTGKYKKCFMITVYNF